MTEKLFDGNMMEKEIEEKKRNLKENYPGDPGKHRGGGEGVRQKARGYHSAGGY